MLLPMPFMGAGLLFAPGENVQQVKYQAAHHELVASAKAVKLATNFDIKPGVGMWDMMKKMTPEAMSNMISGMPEGFIESLNAQLIKVKK